MSCAVARGFLFFPISHLLAALLILTSWRNSPKGLHDAGIEKTVAFETL